MADVVIGAKLQIDGKDAENSVKSIKSQLREAQQEVVKLSDKFGATSNEAQDAAKRAAELKASIGDAKGLIDAFNPDQKFMALSQSLGGVLGGFTALTGAMGLLGVESEDTQKMLLKVQSAMALSQGLNQVGEAVQSFKNLGTVIQSTTIFQKANNAATVAATTIQRAFGVSVVGTGRSFTILKGAIAATGIGLLIVGLAAAADALGVFSSSSDDAADSQANLNEQIQNVNESLGFQTAFLNRRQKEELALAKSKGANAKQLFEIEQKYRDLNISALEDNYKKLAGMDEAAAAKALSDLKDAQTDRRVAELEFQGRNRGGGRATGGSKVKELSAADQFAEEEAKYLKIARDYEMEQFKKKIEVKKIENVELAALDNERFMQSSALQEAQTLVERNNVAARIQLAEQERAGKVQAAQSIGGALGALSDLVGKQTAAGKVLGIAQATINTFIGASEVLRAKSTIPEPFGTISKIANVTAIIATGISAVRNIVKTKVPGYSAGGGGGTNVSSAQAPITPQLPNATRTTLDQQQLNQIGNATVRAFVVESDVSGSQDRIRRLNRAARL